MSQAEVIARPTPNRLYKTAIYGQFARIGKALSSPPRHEILDLLCQGEHTVESLAEKAGLTLANTSRHLQVLRGARLVDTDKRGTYVYYRLAGQEVCDLVLALRQTAEKRITEIAAITRDYLENRGLFAGVDQETLIDLVRRGEVTVVDVRPTDEYEQAHLPGALSIPLTELRQRLTELPADRAIVAYCRGPYCVLAVEAVQLLRKKGFTAERLESGTAEWRSRGGALVIAEAHGLSKSRITNRESR